MKNRLLAALIAALALTGCRQDSAMAVLDSACSSYTPAPPAPELGAQYTIEVLPPDKDGKSVCIVTRA